MLFFLVLGFNGSLGFCGSFGSIESLGSFGKVGSSGSLGIFGSVGSFLFITVKSNFPDSCIISESYPDTLSSLIVYFILLPFLSSFGKFLNT